MQSNSDRRLASTYPVHSDIFQGKTITPGGYTELRAGTQPTKKRRPTIQNKMQINISYSPLHSWAFSPSLLECVMDACLQLLKMNFVGVACPGSRLITSDALRRLVRMNFPVLHSQRRKRAIGERTWCLNELLGEGVGLSRLCMWLTCQLYKELTN